MNTEVTFLRAVSDRKSGNLVVYCRRSDGKITTFFPSTALNSFRQFRDDVIKTERFAKGDRYIAEPPDSIVHSSTDATRFFLGNMSGKERKKVGARLLKDLSKQAERVGRIIEKLEQIEHAFNAGVLSADGREFHDLLREFPNDRVKNT